MGPGQAAAKLSRDAAETMELYCRHFEDKGMSHIEVRTHPDRYTWRRETLCTMYRKPLAVVEIVERDGHVGVVGRFA